MGENPKLLKVHFDRRVRVEFQVPPSPQNYKKAGRARCTELHSSKETASALR
jgi:hypothetical protein